MLSRNKPVPSPGRREETTPTSPATAAAAEPEILWRQSGPTKSIYDESGTLSGQMLLDTNTFVPIVSDASAKPAARPSWINGLVAALSSALTYLALSFCVVCFCRWTAPPISQLHPSCAPSVGLFPHGAPSLAPVLPRAPRAPIKPSPQRSLVNHNVATIASRIDALLENPAAVRDILAAVSPFN
jgi:hypothetical protein